MGSKCKIYINNSFYRKGFHAQHRQVWKRVSMMKLLSSYSWKEVWATDRPFIRCRCFQHFSGCHAMAHSARLDNNNNTSNPSPASALYYKSTFNKRRWCAWWVFFSTQFADRLRNASTSIVGKNTAKVWWFLQAGSFTLICNSIMKEAFRIFLLAEII